VSEWNEAIDAAIALVDQLGADRPRLPHRPGHDAEARTVAMMSAQHTRARTIRRALEGLRR
jgi:hypothetical protein